MMGVYWKYGSEDNPIHCFKDGQPCSADASLLKDQINILINYDVNTNPFEGTDADVDEGNSPTNLIDASDD